MKKFLSAALAGLMSISLVACGSKTGNETTGGETSGNESGMKVAMVTDYGDITDQSFNQTTYEASKAYCDEKGYEFTYKKPASDADADRVASIEEAIEEGYNVIVMPGFAFAKAIVDTVELYPDVKFFALDVAQGDFNTAAGVKDGDPDWEIPSNLFSAVYHEEIAGYMAGYAAVKLGYTKLGFLGGMAVPAVIRYGSGYVQGAAAAAKEKGLENPVSVQYYYAGQFAATPEATEYANTWYANDMAEIIFACGGAVYQSVVEASIQNNNAPWIGVDVNQHADTSLSEGTRGALKTSAMKNLTFATQVLLAGWVNEGEKWNDTLAGEVVTVGAESEMVKLPTPEADNDEGCWGFTNYTVEEYNELYKLVQNGSIKVNSNSDNETLSANNFGVDPTYCTVNYIG